MHYFFKNSTKEEVSFLIDCDRPDPGLKRFDDSKGLEDLLSNFAGSFRVIPDGPEIARIALEIEFPHGDPFDRIIAATAKVHGILLLTRDRANWDSGRLEIVWLKSAFKYAKYSGLSEYQ